MSGQRYVHELRFRLTYADCDPAQIVYYASFYPWFERTSTEFWLSRGLRLDRSLETHGMAFVSRASGCEYLERSLLYDEVVVKMWFSRVGDTSLTMSFDVIREPDETIVATGFNTLVTVDVSGNAICIPESIRELVFAP